MRWYFSISSSGDVFTETLFLYRIALSSFIFDIQTVFNLWYVTTVKLRVSMDSYFSPFAIDDREHWKRKDRNKSSGLEVTVRLIEHSWFRCKFGASRLAGRVTYTCLVVLSCTIYVSYRSWAARWLLVEITSIKRNCRPARNGQLDRL